MAIERTSIRRLAIDRWASCGRRMESETLIGLCELDPDHDIAPGAEGEAKLRFDRAVADLVLSLVHPGFQFSLAEGRTVVAMATVRAVKSLPVLQDR